MSSSKAGGVSGARTLSAELFTPSIKVQPCEGFTPTAGMQFIVEGASTAGVGVEVESSFESAPPPCKQM